MKKLIPIFLLIVLLGCVKEVKKAENTKPLLAKTLNQAVLNYYFNFKEEDAPKYYGFLYYKYINQQSIKNSLTLTDSIKVENLWLVFFKYSINGHDYNQADWFINIKGDYINSGLYISKYNVEENFDKENIDLVKALIDKAEAWEGKSEKRWWKYIN
ncbi:MAG: hypothetical protein ACOYO1_12910 [Bacteroidales bacterium]